MKMNRNDLVVFLISVLVVLNLTSHTEAGPAFKNIVQQNVPKGFTFERFVEVCEDCGVLYGNEFSYKCLIDRSLKMFDGCSIALGKRR